MSKKKMKFRNVGKRAKTFDGFEEDSLGFLNIDNVKKFAEETGQSIADAFEALKKRFGGSRGGMPRKRTGHTDYRKGGMVMSTTNNRKRKT